MPWLSDSSALAREQHLGVSLTTGITMNSDFTNRFDRESLPVLVQGGSQQRKGAGKSFLVNSKGCTWQSLAK